MKFEVGSKKFLVFNN